MLIKKIIYFFLFLCCRLSVASQFPADITLLVADLKYNKEQGVKICEIQHGTGSIFSGYDYLYNGKGLVGENFVQAVSDYHHDVWFINGAITFTPNKKKFHKNGWKCLRSMETLTQDQNFLSQALQPVEDPTSIRSYHTILYTHAMHDKKLERFREEFPGVLLIDAASWGYQGDKYKMSRLFLGDKRLEKVKPRWKLYPKKYTPQLTERILNDMKSDRLVIKPRCAAEGRGVMILSKENLDGVLKQILINPQKLKSNSDKGYNWWSKDKSDSFLVEEYISSDPVYVPAFGNQPFNVTMRVAFALVYDQGEIFLHFLGEYWMLPDKPMNQNGDFSEKNIISLEPKRDCRIDPEIRKEVKSQLTDPLKLMYKKMLA